MQKSNDTYKRMGVFVFFDAAGIVDDYVVVLLKSLREVLQELIIVINGDITDEGCQKLKKLTRKIYIRENLGYDGGAYKDTFTKFLVEEELKRWDEIVLFNDTFYGTFFSWDEIFKKKGGERVDFWGLSRFPKGAFFSTGEEIPEHLQGYFLVCRKSLFLSEDWKNFWKQMVYPETYQEAIENFEIYFSQYFSKRGYKNKAITDDGRVMIASGENPTMWCFDDLIRTLRFPVLKRKVFCLIHLDAVKKTVDYIKDNTDYDISLITAHLERLYREKRIQILAPFDSEEISLFYKRHKRVFIYGYGIYGKGIIAYFEYKKWKYDGIIVSENERKNKKILIYRNMRFDAEDGVILALGEPAFREVYPMIKKELQENQLYYPNAYSGSM